jgi:hypothetical protein
MKFRCTYKAAQTVSDQEAMKRPRQRYNEAEISRQREGKALAELVDVRFWIIADVRL